MFDAGTVLSGMAMAHAICHVEGIGPHYARQLAAAGVITTRHLLQAGATRRDRMALSRRTGISTRLLFKWVNVSDLFRVRGVGGQYAELLVAAGVGTVEALCGCEAEQLAAAMSAVNSKRQRVRTLPNIRRISGWIEHARLLPVLVTG